MDEITGIALGNHKTLEEAKERIKNQKVRLRHVISYNKLKISPSKFKFYYEKESGNYPYYTYVDIPSKEYLWIFQN